MISIKLFFFFFIKFLANLQFLHNHLDELNIDYQTQKVYISQRFLENLMVIKINNLKEGVHQYNLDELVENLGLEEPFTDKVNVDLNLQKLHNQVVLETKLNFKVKFECDRCSEDFNSTLSANYKMVYLFGNNPDEKEESLNVVYLPLDASEIKLDEDIHDYAMLAIPMKKLCKEDCKGLCPHCHKNLNEEACSCDNQEMDSRWMPLKDLKNKIGNN